MYKNPANTSIVGKKVIFMPSCHSTNDICSELISNDDFSNGTVVITAHQIDGKGQGTNVWESEPDANITMSVILGSGFLPVRKQFYLNIITCLAISDMLSSFLDTGLFIKWPNDIFHKDYKISGILIQNTVRGDKLENTILGMGININQSKFTMENAASLKMITGAEYELNKIFEKLCEHIEYYFIKLKNGEYQLLKEKYMQKLMWLNEVHTFRANGKDFRGTIKDIDELGRLTIEIDSGLHFFNFREVTFVE